MMVSRISTVWNILVYYTTVCHILAETDTTSSVNRQALSICEGQDAVLTCPTDTYIVVLSAEFGRRLPSSIICPYKDSPKYQDLPWDPLAENLNCIFPSALEAVQRVCQERRECRVKTNSRTFYPDPCPTTGKYLKLKYECIPITKITEVACENAELAIACDKSKRLNIVNAQYGFDDLIPQKCSSPRLTLPDDSLGCLSYTSETIVKESCFGKRSCRLQVNKATFGDLCPQVGKYLRVDYICVPKAIMKEDTARLLTASLRQDAVSKEDCNCTTTPSVDSHEHNPADSSLAFGWIHSMTYIKANQEKLVLYGLLCASVAFICALIAVIARMFYVKYTKAQRTSTHQKLNVTEPAVQDTSQEENTYIAASDPSDMIQYNLGYRSEATNRLNSGPGSLRGSSCNRVYNNDTPRFNTNSLTVTNPLHGEHRRNLNRSPLTTPSTAMNNSPNTAMSDNRNTYYENSADDECTIDDNLVLPANHTLTYGVTDNAFDARPRTNSLFDRHS
ncbi:protein eva-1 homolog C-like [Watersipora subatra]|uniref:protein eva-1 homolog C-like n=1 Tax=Watersipora subatra TaxID=2589382 RepID=UPI00355BD591